MCSGNEVSDDEDDDDDNNDDDNDDDSGPDSSSDGTSHIWCWLRAKINVETLFHVCR
jgi:hypothetical protein